MSQMTKRQAIKEVRECADAVIEQAERIAKGWDKGNHRSNLREVDRNAGNTIRQEIKFHVYHAFALSRQFAEVA